jgi:hypothetical protein
VVTIVLGMDQLAFAILAFSYRASLASRTAHRIRPGMDLHAFVPMGLILWGHLAENVKLIAPTICLPRPVFVSTAFSVLKATAKSVILPAKHVVEQVPANAVHVLTDLQ